MNNKFAMKTHGDVVCQPSEDDFIDLSPKAVSRIWHSVKRVYKSGDHPSVSFCLRRNGHIVINRTLGYTKKRSFGDDASALVRVTPATPVNMFSASKVITAILLHHLVEQGAVDLDRPVSFYVKEFGKHGKGNITLADVLSHRGGFPLLGLDPEMTEDVALISDWDWAVKRICSRPADLHGKLAYHAISAGYILGEVIQRVSAQPLNEYLDTVLRKPLGMNYFTFGLAQEHHSLFAHSAAVGKPLGTLETRFVNRIIEAKFETLVDHTNEERNLNSVIPAGNLFATAEEMSRFYQMLLDKGMYKGDQILKPETIDRFVRPVGRAAFDRTILMPMRYSRGAMLGGGPYGVFGPNSTRAFGHLGFTNILTWADPDRSISCSILSTGKSLMGSHLIPYFRLLNSIARECAIQSTH